MFNQLGSGFIDLLKDFKESGKQVTVVHSNLGPLIGRLIDVKSDFIQLKIVDMNINTFYNVFIPNTTICAVQTEDEK